MSDLESLQRDLIALRRDLHRHPELSGQEEQTAGRITEFLAACGADEILQGLGGHGVVGIFRAEGHEPGPTVMLRCELDALPLPEAPECPWPSNHGDRAHKCGHDGHMAILLGLARLLSVRKPLRGRALLLFQPAEETGTGAAALMADERFRALEPDWIFALHNLPGHQEGAVLVRPGAFTAGSCGVRIHLDGATAHAAYPEQGRSPDRALSRLVVDLANLNSSHSEDLALVTVTHARLGDPAFGISPGSAEVLATLRAENDAVLARLKEDARNLAASVAADHGLGFEVGFEEEFPVSMNDPRAVELIEEAAEELDLEVVAPEESPFRWSEDFGILTRWRPGAMFGLGAGPDHPVLHGPDYDFNDQLILPGMMMLDRILRLLASDPPA